MKIEIREATLNDVDNGLLDVFIEGYRYHQNGRPDIFQNLTDGELKTDLIQNFGKFSTIILLEECKIIGYLSYMIKEHHDKKLFVDQLVISKNCRHQGYGKKLMDRAKEIATIENCERIELDCWVFNEDAINIYEHIGYKRQRIKYEMSLKDKI